MLYEKVFAEKKRLEQQIDEVRRKLSALPDGNLFCSKNGGHYKWYVNDGKRQSYIPKRERDFAEQLAMRKYLTYRMKDLLNAKNAVDFYLNHYRESLGQAEQMLMPESGYYELLSPYFQPLDRELMEWAAVPYEHNTGFPESLQIRASSGKMVRSKSEAMIDMILHMNRIPFRYECALELGGNIIYPDFTIRHPETGEFYYWEHFGMMDDWDYQLKTGNKLRLYITNGIVPTVQLITTYETLDRPLGPDVIEKIVKEYFL